MTPPHPAPQHTVLKASGLRYEVPGRTLLDAAELTVSAGESVAVTGPSGSGKSTLLMCVLGILRPRAGQIDIAGRNIVRMRSGQQARHRRSHIGMVFQSAELLPELSPVENVALAALLAGTGRRVAFGRAEELLCDLGVPAETATADLSGGERQRAAVARALINQPSLLVADEPTGALDEGNRDSVADLLFSLPEQWGCGLLVVTHDSAIAVRAQRRVAFQQGKLVAMTSERSA